MTNEQTDIPTSSMVNFRDVAETVHGVAAGRLLRSEAPSPTDGDPTDGAWPPATVLDLREPTERAQVHPLADRATVVDLPLLGSSVAAVVGQRFDLPSSLDEIYSLMLEPPASHRLVQAIELIASAPTPVLVHCSAGKDRTGVAVAIALALVDAQRDDIVADYVRTDAAMDSILNKVNEAMKNVMPADSRQEVPEELLRAPASAIEAVLTRLEAHEGGVTGWFSANGGEAATVNALRVRLRETG
jgi:rhodanese-related sulfurtransferase